MTLTVRAYDAPLDKVLLTCDPILSPAGEWTPKVKNCALGPGATIADVLNSMTEMHNADLKYYRSELAKAKRKR